MPGEQVEGYQVAGGRQHPGRSSTMARCLESRIPVTRSLSVRDYAHPRPLGLHGANRERVNSV